MVLNYLGQSQTAIVHHFTRPEGRDGTLEIKENKIRSKGEKK